MSRTRTGLVNLVATVDLCGGQVFWKNPLQRQTLCFAKAVLTPETGVDHHFSACPLMTGFFSHFLCISNIYQDKMIQ